MKKMKKTSRTMTLELFDRIKKLQKAKLKIRQVMLAVDRSINTVTFCFKANTLDEYFEIMRATLKPKKTEPIEVENLTVEQMDEHNSIITILRAIEHNTSMFLENQAVQMEVLKRIEKNTIKKGFFDK